MPHNCSADCIPWLSTQKCHCGTSRGCGATFSNITNFDKHRVSGKCVTPESVGLELNSRGYYVMPGEEDLHDRLQRSKRVEG